MNMPMRQHVLIFLQSWHHWQHSTTNKLQSWHLQVNAMGWISFCKSCNTPLIHSHPHFYRVFREIQAALNLWEPRKLIEYQGQIEHLQMQACWTCRTYTLPPPPSAHHIIPHHTPAQQWHHIKVPSGCNNFHSLSLSPAKGSTRKSRYRWRNKRHWGGWTCRGTWIIWDWWSSCKWWASNGDMTWCSHVCKVILIPSIVK